MKWIDKLEGVGIMFSEPGFYGVHVPNPSTQKSSIMVNFLNWVDEHPDNPQQAAWSTISTLFHEMGHIGTKESGISPKLDIKNEDLNDPRLGEFMKMYLENVHHGGETRNPGHAADWLARTAEIMTSYGPSKTIGAVDELTEILTGKEVFGVKFTDSYNAETQELLRLAKERARRPETTPDYLSPTGIKSESPKRGKGNSPSRTQADSKRAASKLISELENAKGRMEEQEEINRAERAERFSQFVRVRTPGVKGAAKSLSKLRGEFEKANPGEGLNLSQKETDSLFDAIKFANITPGEKARGYTALFKLLNGEKNPVRSELAVLDDVFGAGFSNKITELHGGLGAVALNVGKAANTMKTMANIFDVSTPLRHGIGMMHRGEYYPAMIDMFKFLANQKHFDAAMKAIEEDPQYLQAKEAGLFIPKMGSGTDEEFLDNYIGNIPKATGIPKATRASERAYIGFLNKLRFDVYKNMTARAKDLGHKLFDGVEADGVGSATKEAKAITNFINTFTGRGDFTNVGTKAHNLGGLNRIYKELNIALWSPRMMASRMTMFTNPKIYMDLPKGMRLEGLKSALAIASMGLMVNAIAHYAGANVSGNILSTDFGKSRFGNNLIDPWGGLQQYVVAFARFLTGRTDSKVPTNSVKIAGRFLANKESPLGSLIHTLLTAKKFTGKSDDPKTAGDFITEYDQKTSVQNEIRRRFMPMFEQDIEELIMANPDWAENIGLTAAMAAIAPTGMVQAYPEKKNSSFGRMKVQ